MKKLSYSFFLSLASLSGFTQIVNIPDANFKAMLLSNGRTAVDVLGSNYNSRVDTNNDGQIQVSEAAAVTGLDLHTLVSTTTGNISSLEGIAYFTNLKTLKCFGNQITSLDVSMLSSLNYLDCGNNQISNLNITGLSQLNEAQCDTNNLSSLNLEGLTKIEKLFCQSNHLSSLAFKNIPIVKDLWLSGNDFVTLDVTMLPALEVLSCDNNKMASLNVTGLKNLSEIVASTNVLTAIDLTGLDHLTYLAITGNLITQINLSPATALNSLFMGSNPLSNINLSSLYNLQNLSISNSLVSNIDCSQTSVTQLTCSNNPNLTSINVKNNKYSYSDPDMLYYTFSFDNLPKLLSICLDNGEESNLHYTNFNLSGNVKIYTGDNCDIEVKLGPLAIDSPTMSAFAIYPNPALSTVNIKTNESDLENHTVEMYNLTGAMLKKYENFNSSVQIDISDLSQGTYLIKLIGGKDSTVKKLIKI